MLLIGYCIFAALFSFGVTNAENDRIIDVIMKIILCILCGWFMMPVYLGSWLDLNNKR